MPFFRTLGALHSTGGLGLSPWHQVSSVQIAAADMPLTVMVAIPPLTFTVVPSDLL